VFVGDVARAFEAVIDDDSALQRRYDLCGPKVYTLRELVAYVGELTGYKRPILPLGRGLSKLQARVLEWLPGPLMSRDNLASMELDNVCDGNSLSNFGFPPTALEAVAPGYLATGASKSRYDEFRAQSGR
jgi:NADH dehydrogenase